MKNIFFRFSFCVILFCSFGVRASGLIGHPSESETNASFHWTKLSENPFYVIGGGGYISSGNFNGGMASGVLGWEFAHYYGLHALEFETLGVWEEAKATTSDGEATDHRKTDLNQLLIMVNYRYRVSLGNTPWFFYLGGGMGCDFMTMQDGLFITYSDGFPDDIIPGREVHYTSFCGQGFAGFGYEFTLWDLSWAASAGGRLIGTKKVAIGGVVHPGFDYLSPRVSTSGVHWAIEGALGLRF